MEVTMKSLYESTKDKFKLKLLSGKNNLDSIISWVHLIEDVSNVDFIRGNELIITTGLGFRGEAWLEAFIYELIKKNAKGLIINIGTYIPVIPKSIVGLCEKLNFPLFSMPWEIHLVDIIQNYCNKIMSAERVELTETSMFLKALLTPERKDEYEVFLDEHGYDINGDYCVAIIQTPNELLPEEKTHVLKQIRINMMNHLHPYHLRYSIIIYHEQLIIIFHKLKNKQIKKYVEDLKSLLNTHYESEKTLVVVGPTVTALTNLHKSFKRAFSATNKKYMNPQGICYYDDLGIEKVLIEVEDHTVLLCLYEEMLGALVAYDNKHQTQYLEILRLYLWNDCSIHAVAKQSFTHRNTIHYRMNKIKAILPYDLSSVEYRFRYQLAFYIKDLLSKKLF